MTARALALTAICSLASFASPASSETPATGEAWEITSQMVMEGMPMQMPKQTQRVCQEKNWSEPPGAKRDESCRITDLRTSGNTTTWNMTCTGRDAMSGRGEITRTPNSYTGAITMSSEYGAMKIQLSGKLLGECELPK
jgi:hypothetical protein